MQVYMVLRDEGAPAAESLFIRDGFSWSAFLLAPFWLLRHAVWAPFLAYLLAAVGISLLNVGPEGAIWLFLALHAFIGLEGQNMRVTSLTGRGWQLAGIVTGDELEEAEIRYFTDLDAAAARATPPAGLGAGPWGARTHGDPA